MKRVMYKDCNNNAGFLKEIFTRVQTFSDVELCWNIFNLDLIPVDRGDFINGQPDNETRRIYDFQKRTTDEHTVYITHSVFMDLLDDVKTIYEGYWKTFKPKGN